MAISKVGLGWDVGERDYASLNLWLTAKSGSGVYEEAWCKGSCTTATLNITSGFAAGALIYGDIVYDGSNESDLAFANNRINNAIANVVIQDLSISQSNNFTITATANGSGALFKRCRLKHLGTHGTSYGAIQAINGGGAENTVASTVGQRISVHSFNNPLSFVKCLFFGSTNYGVGPIYSAFQTVDKCFSFNNTNEDYFRANPSDSPTDCASEDSTGNVTGYTSAECVNFAAADYRIKNTSDLHALNIGAFFEPSGSTEYVITPEPASYSYSGSAVGLLFNAVLSPNSGSFSYNGQQVSLFVGRVLTPESGLFSYTGGAVSLLANRLMTPQTGICSYTGGAVVIEYNAGAVSYVITPESAIYFYAGNSARLLVNRVVNPQAGSYSYNGQAVALIRDYALTPESGGYTYQGQAVGLLASRVLTPAAGVYNCVGGAVAIDYSGVVLLLIDGYQIAYAENPVQFAYRAQSAQLAYKSASVLLSYKSVSGA